MTKVTDESERSVPPEKTVETVFEAVERIGVKLTLQTKDFDRFFWISQLDIEYLDMRNADRAQDRSGPGRGEVKIPDIRMGGKGPSENQCLASGCMEFIERWSLYRWDLFEREEYDCLDLKEGKWYKIKPFLEMRDTKCLASGNNYEEAVLHCLHELLETRTPLTDPWNSCRIVPVRDLFPEAAEWICQSIVLVLSPLPSAPFTVNGARYYKFTALQYPFNREFDAYRPLEFRKLSGGRLLPSPAFRDPKQHSPNSGGAAGLNPKMTAYRAMNEIFQFQNRVEDYKAGKRKPLPGGFPVAESAELINVETDSITDDIKMILNMLGDDVFVGIIDLTDPEIGIPVVKLISNYDPRYSLVSEQMLHVFFDF